MSISLAEVLRDWRSEDLGNLCSILGISPTRELGPIETQIMWLYHSKTIAEVESAARKTVGWVLSKVSASEQGEVKRDELREVPSYDELLIGACKHLSAYEEGGTIAEREAFLSQAIIIAALQRMKPRERMKFFEQQINASAMVRDAKIGGTTLTGPATTFALLGAAQASGFGVYVASTTALGFLTHAVGITLPFAVYTGMTSTIAFLIGPAGWLTAGLWGAWKLTQPEWKKLVPALVYIIAVNSSRGLGGAPIACPPPNRPRGGGAAADRR